MAKIMKESSKNVMQALAEIRKQQNMELGVDEIEFPDGSKEKFYYNGEKDRQAAIKFATICVNATENTLKAKEMMGTCFALLTQGINPDRIIKLYGKEYYLDSSKSAIYNKYALCVAELTEEEKNLNIPIDAMEIILRDRLQRQIENERCIQSEYDEEDYEYDDEDEDEDEEEDW